jgi:hypothetical protein
MLCCAQSTFKRTTVHVTDTVDVGKKKLAAASGDSSRAALRRSNAYVVTIVIDCARKHSICD